MLRRAISSAAAVRLAKHWEPGAPLGMAIDRPPADWMHFTVKVRGHAEVDANYIGRTRPEIAAVLSGMVAFGWDLFFYDGSNQTRGGRAVRTFFRHSRWAGEGGMLMPLERAAIFDQSTTFDFHGEFAEHERKAREARRTPRARPPSARILRTRARYPQSLDWMQPLHELGHIALIEREREAGRDPRVLPDAVGLEVDCAVWELKLVMAVWGVFNIRTRALVAAHHDNHRAYKLRAAWDRVPGPEPRLVRAVKCAYARAVEGRWAAFDDSRGY